MADISKITLPSGNTYELKDAVAREMISGGISFIVAWDGASTPVPASIPAGVKVTYQGTTYTGTLSAETEGTDPHAQAGAFYLVKSATNPTSETLDVYDEYVPVGTTGSKFWEKIGDTKIDLTDVVTGVTLNKSTDSALGDGTTFTNSTSTVTFGTHTKDKVLGENTTFSVTDPTVTVTPSTTYVKATASGTAIGSDGTANAVTGYENTTSDTFVKSVSAETDKSLDTTSVPNVTAAGTASTWSFTMGSGDAAETLIIGGANGTAPTLGTAITVATGTTSTGGQGDQVVTGVTVGTSASALTGLGTPSTTAVLTGVKVTAQPTIALATDNASGTGKVQVATGISNASASGTAVTANSDDEVDAITALGTGTAGAQTITVGTNDKVTVLTDGTSLTVTKGNA